MPERVQVSHVCERSQRAEAEAARLRAELAAALELAEDMRAYVPDYFAEKWKHDEGMERLRSAVESDQGGGSNA